MKIEVNVWADSENSYPDCALEIKRSHDKIALKLSDEDREIVLDADDFMQAVLCVHGSCKRQ